MPTRRLRNTAETMQLENQFIEINYFAQEVVTTVEDMILLEDKPILDRRSPPVKEDSNILLDLEAELEKMIVDVRRKKNDDADDDNAEEEEAFFVREARSVSLESDALPESGTCAHAVYFACSVYQTSERKNVRTDGRVGKAWQAVINVFNCEIKVP